MSFKNFGSNQSPPLADGGGNKPPGNYTFIRQPSFYSLTFDEFQTTMGGIGKDFGSMNMDELLKKFWSAEETQTMASSNGGVDGNGRLQRQGSLNLPRTLSQKTVEELWKDISKEYSIGKDGIGTGGETSNNKPPRQQTLGEMTLEEFLVKAGVVREDTQLAGKVSNVNGGFFNSGFGIQASKLPLNVNGVRSNQHQQPIFPKQPAVVEYGAQIALQTGGQGLINGFFQGDALQAGGVGMVGVGGPVGVANGSPAANQVSSEGIGNGKSSGDTSSVSPAPYVFNGSLSGRKPSAVDKVAERRQRRMIKNRESAARSRARKQAYIMELEAEVAKLKEENQELQKKHAEIIKMEKNQVMEMMNMQQGAKRRCLRRTLTGPW